MVFCDSYLPIDKDHSMSFTSQTSHRSNLLTKCFICIRMVRMKISGVKYRCFGRIILENCDGQQFHQYLQNEQ